MKIDSYDKVVKWSYKLAKGWILDNLIPKGINSSRKFEAYKRSGGYLPSNFPRKPDEYFKKNSVWLGWTDFFSKSTSQGEKKYSNYAQAAVQCRRHGIQNSIQYRSWNDRPGNLPARPDQYYKEEWEGWQAFLGSSYQVPDKKVSSKLIERDVRIIKHQLKLGVPGSVLAKNFGVSEMQISRIKHGENWNSIESP